MKVTITVNMQEGASHTMSEVRSLVMKAISDAPLILQDKDEGIVDGDDRRSEVHWKVKEKSAA